jgi:hypothetical protein
MTIQAKLVVGASDDSYEREADQVADDATAAIEQRAAGDLPATGVQSSATTRIRRMASSVGAAGGAVDAETEQAIASTRSGGRPLDAPLRRSMESAIGADFGGIRVHVGQSSDELNRRVQSRAFTTGSDVFVRRQDYAPGTAAGRRLLAHELTHTVQQGAAPALGAASDPVAAGHVQRLALAGVIQRDDDDEVEDDDVEEEEVVDVASVTGESGPTGLRSEFDTTLAAAKKAIAELSVLQVVNSVQLGIAKKKLAATQDLVDELERLAELVEKKKGQAEKLIDGWDGEFDGPEYEALIEASSDFDSLLPKVKSGFSKISEEFLEASGQLGIAEETLLQGAAQAEKLKALRGRWATAALAKGHYEKHKGDTGAANEEEYLTRAAALNDKVAGGTIKRKERDGDTLTMDTATKDFTVLSDKGKIRTFFRPGDGIRYFNRQ